MTFICGNLLKMNGSILLILTTLATFGSAANILVMMPMPLYSHTINYMPIFRELAARGHNVTIVSPFPQKTPVPNITDYVVPNKFEDLKANMNIQRLMTIENNMFFQVAGLWMFSKISFLQVFEEEQVQRFIKDTDSKFDVVIAETWFIQFPLVAFGHKYNCPVINIMPTSFFPTSAYLTGNHLSAAYTPLTALGYNDHMTFIERIHNSFYYYVDIILGQIYFLDEQDSLMRKHFKYPGSENLPHLKDLLRNTSLTLMDHHPALSYPLPLYNNIVQFGGINAQSPEKLPYDLQKIMDNAKDGVIYISFGSYLSITHLTPQTQDAVLSAIGKVKQKVLLKLENATLLENYKYKNIEVRSWFPQASILAHPNCKLFITHAGIHGLMEGVYHAVPFVAIPMMSDQRFNAKFIETVGIGKFLDKYSITSEQLLNAINTVINDPTYRERMNERSAIFKDNPKNILDNAIFWIEYVIRHRGAPHLRPAVHDLYWFQIFMLDVIAFYALTICSTIFIFWKMVKLFFNFIVWMCCSNSEKNKLKKSKQQ